MRERECYFDKKSNSCNTHFNIIHVYMYTKFMNCNVKFHAYF